MSADYSHDLPAKFDALAVENSELRIRLEEAEEILQAIRSGSIDAVVVGAPDEPQVYTLRGADHPYRVFVETMKEGAVTLADDLTILYCNQAFAGLVRSPMQKVIGGDIRRFMSSSDADLFEDFIDQSDAAKCELHVDTANGEQVPVFLSRTAAHIDGVNAICLVITDLTQQKRHEALLASEAERERLHSEVAQERARLAELNETLEMRVQERTEQVQTLSRSLTLAEQRERRRISQVLHDDLQQLLFGLEMRLTMLEMDLVNGSNGGGRVLLDRCKDLRNHAQQAIYISRTLSIELNPPILEGEGLKAALEWLGSHMAERYGLDVNLEVADDADLHGLEERGLLVQLVRELLFNIVKHAGVNRCNVHAYIHDGSLAITIEDQGAGFNVEEVRATDDHRTSLGLFSVSERLRLFGGELDIRSSEGAGTRVTIFLPRTPVKQLRS